ncbi:hypothetical protein [Nocardiopsis sp. Huas11]|uniref:hypothetical protein n=1 Tax=Nocardiopsis sp. Huas11 TaxID=2183912 RepID=UPI000EAE664E|nr:hypothetical protein [Nocardiopsis sp. Huas11]
MDPQEPFVADHRAGRTRAVVEGALKPLGNAALADHAGPPTPARHGEDGAAGAFGHDRSAVLVLSGPRGERRLPTAVPGDHPTGEASDRYVVVTTGPGANARARSDVVTLVDLERGASVRLRSRAGEPGAVIVPDQAGDATGTSDATGTTGTSDATGTSGR